MATVEGTTDSQFTGVKDTLNELIDAGEDVGASITVLVEGKPVVDVWGGWADEAKTTPWDSDTITNVWSTTKTMTALCALILIDRGVIDPDAPVATYWPEFAENGKEGVLVRHLMSHTSGVSAWEQPVDTPDIYDWESSTARLASQAPWWEPGTASGYHALNYGHLIGEVIRRSDGRPLKTFFAEEVAGPLGADFTIGAPESEFGRIANVIPPPPLPIPEGIPADSIMIKTFSGPAPDASVAWTPQWRAADIGGANGHGNARSVARAQSVIANGGSIDGVRLVSPETIERIFEQQSDGVDQVLGVPVRFGIGYALETGETPYLPSERVCFWGGWGGSLIVNDLERNLTISYMMNKMSPGLVGSPSSRAITEAVYAALS